MSPRRAEDSRMLFRKPSTPGDEIYPKPLRERIATCLFFTAASLLSTFLNKAILTTYRFPSIQVVALSHLIATVVILHSLKRYGKIHFPDLEYDALLLVYNVAQEKYNYLIGFGYFLIAVLNLHLLKSFGYIEYPKACYDFCDILHRIGVVRLAFGFVLVVSVSLYALNPFSKMKYRQDTFIELLPLTVVSLGGFLLSLGATKLLSLPMLLMLRRFGIPLTMAAEYYMLNIRPEASVQLSVVIIILGAILAGANDLTFSVEGYACAIISNFFGAYYDVYTKTRLDEDAGMGKYGLLYYCSLFGTPFLLLITYYNGDLGVAFAFSSWRDPSFIVQFVLSAVMGCVVSYSVVLCTHYNSALGVNIVACIKCALVAYLGMYIGEDYVFTWLSFFGINLSLVGSFLYSYITLRSTKPAMNVPSV